MKSQKKSIVIKTKKIIFIFMLFAISKVSSQCWKSVSQNYFQTKAIKTDGTLWRWGTLIGDNLGIPNVTTQESVPTPVNSDTDWSEVSTGPDYTIALKTNGTIWSWGRNGNYGNLGHPATVDLIYPTQIGIETNWKTISAGDRLAVAIKKDGTLWWWSSNTSSSFYYNSISNVPTQVGTSTNWSSISVGDSHFIALKTNGTLWSCGDNFFGQLGNGTNTSLTLPTQIGTDTNWKTISAGAYFCLALKTNGSLWAWGKNQYSQLGDGTIINKNIPIQIGTASNWKSINGAQMDHSLALKTDGTLWCWGRNTGGVWQWIYCNFSNTNTNTNWYRYKLEVN